MHKAPTFAVFERGHDRLHFPQFFVERLIPKLKPAMSHLLVEDTCHCTKA